MSKKENDFFLEFLSDVKPIKKKNKIKRSIPSLKETVTVSKKPTKKNENLREKVFEKPKTNKKLETETNNPQLLSKIKKGKIPVEKTIDLHGYSLEDARQLFIQVIKDCYFKDIRCLLFITGKGAGKKNNHDQTQTKLFYGKIRNDFLNWARHESIQQKILLAHQASAKYGGDGAFFIYLRRRKF